MRIIGRRVEQLQGALTRWRRRCITILVDPNGKISQPRVRLRSSLNLAPMTWSSIAGNTAGAIVTCLGSSPCRGRRQL